MTKIVVVYASTYGNTEKLAKAVRDGAESQGATVLLKKTEEVTKEDLISSNGIILGSPVHMGSMDWRMKKFIDEICSELWMKNQLNGRVGGVFSTGGGFGNAGGGCELTLLSMLNNLAELGLIIVPLPKTLQAMNLPVFNGALTPVPLALKWNKPGSLLKA